MTRYLIKATYMSGPHTGKSYLLRKGGYVTQLGQNENKDTTYMSENTCRKVCRDLFKNNEVEVQIERKTSKPCRYIYEHMSYVPVTVEVNC